MEWGERVSGEKGWRRGGAIAHECHGNQGLGSLSIYLILSFSLPFFLWGYMQFVSHFLAN